MAKTILSTYKKRQPNLKVAVRAKGPQTSANPAQPINTNFFTSLPSLKTLPFQFLTHSMNTEIAKKNKEA